MTLCGAKTLRGGALALVQSERVEHEQRALMQMSSAVVRASFLRALREAFLHRNSIDSSDHILITVR